MGSVPPSSINTSINTDKHETVLPQREFNQIYELGESIGNGSFASVHKCRRKSDQNEFAVKIINKTILSNKELTGLHNETHILKKLSHKNIIKLIDLFDDGQNVSMVLELCNGKDLLDEIIALKQNRYSECKTAEIVYALSDALQYMHENFIVHRDIKPENILFNKDKIPKITDFGLAYSGKLSMDSSYNSILMSTCCGTPHYVAPEIIKSQSSYNCKCDIWSLGVILYIMLSGRQPFHASSLDVLYCLIASANYNFKGKQWENVSREAKHLVGCLMERDPEKRYSAKQIKCHPFITKYINRREQ